MNPVQMATALCVKLEKFLHCHRGIYATTGGTVKVVSEHVQPDGWGIEVRQQ
jgi:hypothetical protein